MVASESLDRRTTRRGDRSVIAKARDYVQQMKTSSRSLLALAAGLAALVFRYVQSVPADPDLWGHTRFGLDHIRAGHLARTDPFSFMTTGQEWVNHEWLTELIFGWVFMAGGTTGLFLFRAAIFSAIAALLFGMCWSSWKNGFVLLLLAAGVLPLLAVEGSMPDGVFHPHALGPSNLIAFSPKSFRKATLNGGD